MNNILKTLLNLSLFCFLSSATLLASQNITICGTGDSQKLIKALAVAYEEEHPDTTINIPRSIGSGGGIKNTALDRCDIGRVARPLNENEKKYNLEYLLFAYSPIVFVVNQSVKNITNVTTQNIIDIYSGHIKKWNHFDKTSESKIYVVRREPGDSATAVLDEKIKGFKAIKYPVGKVIYNTPDTVKVLSKHKGTIGYLVLSETLKTGHIVLNFNGVKPTAKNIQQELYNLISPFGLVYKKSINKSAKDFIAFIYTKRGKHIIELHGAISTFKVKVASNEKAKQYK